jgi:hypothetical protein
MLSDVPRNEERPSRAPQPRRVLGAPRSDAADQRLRTTLTEIRESERDAERETAGIRIR